MQVTNEELSALIQQGHKEYIPELWNNVYKLLYLKCSKAYARYKEPLTKRGITIEDFKQEAYDVCLKAIQGYKSTEPFPFISYLKYPLMKKVAELLGIRRHKDILNYCTSLDELLVQDDESGNTILDTVSDTDVNIEDDAVKQGLNTTAEQLVWEQVNATLPERDARTVTERYKNGLTQKQTAEVLNISNSRVGQIEHKALRKLSNNPQLKLLADAYGLDSYKVYHASISNYLRYGNSAVEQVAIERVIADARYQAYINSL